jgi:hypothetical protein
MKKGVSLKICIFIILSLISFTIEHTILTSQKTCNKKNIILANLVSLLHNFGSIYLSFGSLLFGHYILHLIMLIIVFILWYLSNKFYKNLAGCVITQIYNNLCGFDKSRHFHDIHYYIFNTIFGVKNFSVLLIIGIGLYDLYHIFFKFF